MDHCTQTFVAAERVAFVANLAVIDGEGLLGDFEEQLSELRRNCRLPDLRYEPELSARVDKLARFAVRQLGGTPDVWHNASFVAVSPTCWQTIVVSFAAEYVARLEQQTVAEGTASKLARERGRRPQ
jgi:hypothetical protein